MTSVELIVWGTVAHVVADWFLQNDWQAVGKTDLKNFAAHVHCWFHFGCLAFVFPLYVALLLAWVHMLIDTRKPLEWYRARIGQAKEGNPVAVHVKIWQDQAAHFLCIALAAALTGNGA